MSANSLFASRTDVLSVIVLGLISAFGGSTPSEDKILAICTSILSNLYAMVTSVMTLWRVVSHEMGDGKTNLQSFRLSLPAMTFNSSAMALLSLLSPSISKGRGCCGIFLIVNQVFASPIYAIVTLVLAYVKDCEDPDIPYPSLCEHSTSVFVGALVTATVVGVVGGVVIVFHSVTGSASVVENMWKTRKHGEALRDDQPHSVFGAVVTRVSALAKVCLLGAYWFLVDADLKWDYTINGNDAKWWVTGQWAKQGNAIANNFFNHLC